MAGWTWLKVYTVKSFPLATSCYQPEMLRPNNDQLSTLPIQVLRYVVATYSVIAELRCD